MARTLQGLAAGLMCWIVAAGHCSTLSAAGCSMRAPPTLREQLEAADVVYYAQPVSLGDDKFGWNILQTLKPGAPYFAPGERAELPLATSDGPPRNRLEGYAIFGVRSGSNTLTDWAAVRFTPAAARYLREMPLRHPWQPETTRRELLIHLLDHLEHEDDIIADDAVEELRRTEFDDLASIFDDLPRQKLRFWLQSENTRIGRLGMYGLMLGLCGTTDDGELLRAIVEQPTDEFRLNIELLMFGYLLLAGEPGLAVIEESKIKNPKSPFSETYAALGAIRLMWQHGRIQFGPERLQSSMRLMLDRPELADLVVADLARMEDWSVQDRLMKLYDEPEFNIPAIKRAIVRYFLHGATFPAQPEPDHVRTAKQHLAALTEHDPKTVEQAKKFFRFQKK